MNQVATDSKKAVVSEIIQKMKESQPAIVVEYCRLSAAEVTESHKNLCEEGVEFKVYRSSLAQRVTVEVDADDLIKNLTGLNAIVFGSDVVAPTHVLTKFAKRHEHLVLKSGIVEGKAVGVDTTKELSSLPDRESMLSVSLSCLQSPVRGFTCAVRAVTNAKDGSFAEEAAPRE